MSHDRIDTPGLSPERAKIEEEIPVRIVEESWRIRNGIDRSYPRRPYATAPGALIPDADAIRKGVEDDQLYNRTQGDTIEKRKEIRIEGKVQIGKRQWKYPRTRRNSVDAVDAHQRACDRLGYDPRHQPWGWGPKYKERRYE